MRKRERMTDQRIPHGVPQATEADSHHSANAPRQDIVTGPGIPKPGDLIAAKYEVERVLGIGGMGVVLATRHVQLGQHVATKFMHAEAARDPSAAGRFLREAQAAVALTSEHVTRVLDVGTLESGAPYMVMEYRARVDLGDMLQHCYGQGWACVVSSSGACVFSQTLPPDCGGSAEDYGIAACGEPWIFSDRWCENSGGVCQVSGRGGSGGTQACN